MPASPVGSNTQLQWTADGAEVYDRIEDRSSNLDYLPQSTSQYQVWISPDSSLAPPENRASTVFPDHAAGGILIDPPTWNITPAHSDTDIIITDCFALWRDRPNLVNSSPEEPRPLELLYGSKSNFLANVIHDCTREWPLRDPERLASGWLTYHYIKWMMRPSEARYSLLQEFQKPVMEQVQHPHPYFIDLLFWPGLRANLVKYRYDYDPRETVGMILCCMKLRWPWGKNFLEPDEYGHLRMRGDFYETFTNLEAWKLTDDFAKKFPKLVDGLGMDFLPYHES